ncbi:Porin domain and Eukaryotic porin/Tom40 family-containing protein [Strongyloides ratti]|uniref:Porin domain and Eukaryotic porin/Tom40 family-containing protein n=1 Tax=Strongyloides ratti TaxID=34506 RepID=A0A090LDU1_STRRB|nr:Porin domain and Eukaryotic porin/Tom40 family-containing protein [Strongyloides ratti]CEF67966.1 Porin domain and Eukaryotic porin/Tom40 family-containing protein [Strongyloides ratti]
MQAPPQNPPPSVSESFVDNNSTNPGSFDELHRKCRDIFPLCFEGAKVMLQKGISSHFQVSHTLNLSPNNTGYKLGATYVGYKQLKQGEAFPVFLGDTDVNGNTAATVIHQFGDSLRCKLQAQAEKNTLSATQGSLEYRGRLWTSAITAANVDIINNSGIVIFNYLRKLTKHIDAGAEFVHQYGIPTPGGMMSVVSYALRYTANDFVTAATFGSSGLHLSYFHKQAENLAFGVEFEHNSRMEETVTTVGYQTEIPEIGVTMKASLDTNWSVGGVFEKRLSNKLPFTLAVSGLWNHAKCQGKFGVGFIVG